MRNKNLIVLGSALLVALLLFGVSRLAGTRALPAPGPDAPSLTADANTPSPAPEPTPAATTAPTPEVTPAPTASVAPALTATPAVTAAPSATPSASEAPSAAVPAGPAKAYLVVTVNNMMYEPIPLTGEGSYTLTQKDIDAVNVIHVTQDSVFMESSTCEGQDCVKQGTVSLENREHRVLGNMIICLPNRVSLELYTPEEAKAMFSADEADAP